MAAILISFFAVVIVVNLIMARFALSTFGGKVVENSYVASQHYNEWLQRAETQERLGWDMKLDVGADRHAVLLVRKDEQALRGLAVTATLAHPLGQTEPRPLRFVADADGTTLRSVQALPAGRWRVDLSIRHGADEARYRADIQ
jgi:nitrogen fixation protein FixH